MEVPVVVGFAGVPCHRDEDFQVCHAVGTGICRLAGLPGFPALSLRPAAFLWLLAAPGAALPAWQWGQLPA